MKKLLCLFLLVTLIITAASCARGEASEIKGTIKEFWDAYNSREFSKCMDYCSAVEDEEIITGWLALGRAVTGEVTVESIKNISVSDSTATASVTITWGDETMTDTVNLVKENGKWKMVWGEAGMEEVTEVTFELVEWKIVDDDGWPGLYIKFTATGDISLYLNDPDGLQVDWDFISEGTATASILDMAGYEEVPKAGQYRLIVQDIWDETISTSSFDFLGADGAISEVSLTWLYWSYAGDYSLDGISFKVTNSGDLPVYISKGSLTLDSKHDDLYIFDGCVLPNEDKTFSPTTYVSDVTSGQKTLALELKDGADKVVCSYLSTVTPSQ